MIQALWERIIARHGQTVVLTRKSDGSVLEAKAFLQPVLKEREDLPLAVTPLGGVSDQRWMYLGGASTPLEAGDRLASEGLKLVVQESQVVYWDEDALYCRAILRREKEAEQ